MCHCVSLLVSSNCFPRGLLHVRKHASLFAAWGHVCSAPLGSSGTSAFRRVRVLQRVSEVCGESRDLKDGGEAFGEGGGGVLSWLGEWEYPPGVQGSREVVYTCLMEVSSLMGWGFTAQRPVGLQRAQHRAVIKPGGE